MVELFGRNCGETSPLSSLLAGVDRAMMPEVPFNVVKLAELVVRDKRPNPSQYAIVTISEATRMVGGTGFEYGEANACTVLDISAALS